MYQVLVIGGGPAGAFLSYLLTRAGVEVILLEKECLPRDKPCGGGLTPRALSLFDFSLAPIIEDKIEQLVFTHRFHQPVVIKSRTPLVYTTSRDKFDSFLLQKAQAAGCRVVDSSFVRDLSLQSNFINIHTQDNVWQARMVVGADGPNSIVARKLALAQHKKKAYTLTCRVKLDSAVMASRKGEIKVDYGQVPGYGWIIPKQDYLSVGAGNILTGTRCKVENLRLFLKNFLTAEGFKEIIPQLKVWGWSIPINLKPNDLHTGRALVVGDAAGLADPLTGEGIYPALLSAQLAAETIIEQIKRPNPDLSAYTTHIMQRFQADIASASRLARWVYSLPGLIHCLLPGMQPITEGFISLVNGEISYNDFLKTSYKYFRKRVLL